MYKKGNNSLKQKKNINQRHLFLETHCTQNSALEGEGREINGGKKGRILKRKTGKVESYTGWACK